MQIFNYILVVAVPVIFALAFVGAIIGFVGILKNGAVAIANTKEGVRLFRDTHFNPINVLYLPGRLSERGRTARNKMLLHLLLLVFCVVLGMFGQYMTTL